MEDPKYAKKFRKLRGDARRKRMENPKYRRERLEYQKDRRYRVEYGISLEVYEEMVAAQGGRCLICRRKKKLCVDHDHKTGVVRGLLCPPCNHGIGSLKDNPVLLKRAINYLMEEGEM